MLRSIFPCFELRSIFPLLHPKTATATTMDANDEVGFCSVSRWMNVADVPDRQKLVWDDLIEAFSSYPFLRKPNTMKD